MLYSNPKRGSGTLHAMAEIYWVEAELPGKVGVCERPRGGPFLIDDMHHLRRLGVDVLVSALVDQEVERAWLLPAPEAAVEAGIELVRIPTGNLMTPNLEATLPTLHDLAARIRDGQGVAAHCWAGVGRSPTIAASLMVLLGIEPGEAWSRITRARGRETPDTREQERWVYGLWHSLGAK